MIIFTNEQIILHFHNCERFFTFARKVNKLLWEDIFCQTLNRCIPIRVLTQTKQLRHTNIYTIKYTKSTFHANLLSILPCSFSFSKFNEIFFQTSNGYVPIRALTRTKLYLIYECIHLEVHPTRFSGIFKELLQSLHPPHPRHDERFFNVARKVNKLFWEDIFYQTLNRCIPIRVLTQTKQLSLTNIYPIKYTKSRFHANLLSILPCSFHFSKFNEIFFQTSNGCAPIRVLTRTKLYLIHECIYLGVQHTRFSANLQHLSGGILIIILTTSARRGSQSGMVLFG